MSEDKCDWCPAIVSHRHIVPYEESYIVLCHKCYLEKYLHLNAPNREIEPENEESFESEEPIEEKSKDKKKKPGLLKYF